MGRPIACCCCCCCLSQPPACFPYCTAIKDEIRTLVDTVVDLTSNTLAMKAPRLMLCYIVD